MKAYQVHIKNMVCDRCIYFVEQSLKQLKVQKAEVCLGSASFVTSRKNIEEVLDVKLKKVGLSILRTKEEILIESIKREVGRFLDGLEQHTRNRKFSSFLQRRIGKSYYNLSKFFKDTENITLELYIISQKVERVKRLIHENELSLKEIAERLHYSSLQHLSAQFRRITGITVTQFKKQIATRKLVLGSISEVLSDLKSRGFCLHFIPRGNVLRCNELSFTIGLRDVNVKEVYRFEDNPRGVGHSAIFEVETTEGLKGFMICQ